MSIEKHLDDIDFRSREQRQAFMVEDLMNCYNGLVVHNQAVPLDPFTMGQQIMLSNVLWYMLPEKDYRKLVRLKNKPPTKPN